MSPMSRAPVETSTWMACEKVAREVGRWEPPAAATSKAGGLRRANAIGVTTAGRPREACPLAVAGDHHRGTVGQEPDADA